MSLGEITNFFRFFTKFEAEFSYWYLLIFFGTFIYLIFKERKKHFKTLEKNWLWLSVIIIIAIYIITNYSPFADTLDSRSEDYKLAAKYYSEDQRYTLCHVGNSLNCQTESNMEKAPGYSFLMSFFFDLFGSNSKTASYFNFLIALFTVSLFYLTLFRITKSPFVPFITTLLLIGNGAFIKFSTESTVMNITAMFTILSFYLMTHKNKLLVVFALLALSYMRAEYMIFLFIYVAMNFKKIKFNKNKFTSTLLIIITIFLMLHSLSEMSHHTSSTGEYLSVKNMIDRAPERFTQIQGHVYLIPFLLAIFLKRKNIKYPLIFISIYMTLILSFQFDGFSRYGIPLIPVYLLLVGIGANNLANLTKKKYPYLLFILLFTFYAINTNFVSTIPDIVITDSFDTAINLIESQGEDTIFTHNQPLASRVILETKLNSVLITSIDLIDDTMYKALESNTNVFLAKISAPVHEEEIKYIFAKYEADELFQIEDLTIYEIKNMKNQE